MSPNAPLISGNVKEELKDARCPCAQFKARLARDPSIASQLCAAGVCRAAARCSLQQQLMHTLLFSQLSTRLHVSRDRRQQARKRFTRCVSLSTGLYRSSSRQGGLGTTNLVQHNLP